MLCGEFEFVNNLKVAKELGLMVTPMLLIWNRALTESATKWATKQRRNLGNS